MGVIDSFQISAHSPGKIMKNFKFSNLSIFCYEDYRQFLQDIFNLMVAKNPAYSYRKLSEDLGFSSAGYIRQVIKGQRNLGKTGQRVLVTRLGMNASESDYLREMVRLSHAGSGQEQMHRDALRIRRNSQKNRFLITQPYEYYLSNRMCSVIPLLISVYQESFRADSLWISRKINIKTNLCEIDSALTFLLREKLIIKDQGQYQVVYKQIVAGNGERSLVIRRAHEHILEEAMKSLLRPVENREFGHSTLVIPADAKGIVKEKVRAMQEDFKNWIEHSVIKKNSTGKSKLIAVFNTQFYTILD